MNDIHGMLIGGRINEHMGQRSSWSLLRFIFLRDSITFPPAFINIVFILAIIRTKLRFGMLSRKHPVAILTDTQGLTRVGKHQSEHNLNHHHQRMEIPHQRGLVKHFYMKRRHIAVISGYNLTVEFRLLSVFLNSSNGQRLLQSRQYKFNDAGQSPGLSSCWLCRSPIVLLQHRLTVQECVLTQQKTMST